MVRIFWLILFRIMDMRSAFMPTGSPSAPETTKQVGEIPMKTRWKLILRIMTSSAAEMYEAAYRGGNTSPSLLNNYGCLMLLLKNYGESEKLFREATQRRDSHPILFRNYTILLIKLKKNKEAREAWDVYQKRRDQIMINGWKFEEILVVGIIWYN